MACRIFSKKLWLKRNCIDNSDHVCQCPTHTHSYHLLGFFKIFLDKLKKYRRGKRTCLCEVQSTGLGFHQKVVTVPKICNYAGLYIINPWTMFLYVSQSFLFLAKHPLKLGAVKGPLSRVFFTSGFFSRNTGLLLIMQKASYWICQNFSKIFLTQGWPQASATLVVNKKTSFFILFYTTIV